MNTQTLADGADFAATLAARRRLPQVLPIRAGHDRRSTVIAAVSAALLSLTGDGEQEGSG
jgi:hypothetical protein